ncbi:MAG: radical SAM protein [Firmicutes bacterium]|nr:radical SAM protein [Bacillota bacterium]
MTYTRRINLDCFPLWEKMKGKGLLSQVSMELTERCNNNCIHCYVNLPIDDEEAKQKEITFAEIRKTVDEAAKMGCLFWYFTGGEPLLREDFSDIYLYLKRKGMRVTLFTNAILIDSEIARLFKKYPPQNLEVSTYGLSQKTYEAVTRNPGSFDAFMQGINLLKENNIPFTLKTAVLQQNFHEIEKMRDFAQSLTGEPLGVVLKLNLGSRFNGGSKRNFIKRLRLSPGKIMEVLKQDEESYRKDIERFCQKFLGVPKDDQLFICGAGVGGCHIDAYNNFQLCMLLRHPDCVYSLRKGSFKEAWEKFVPQVREIRANNKKYQNKCQRCFLKSLCEQCPAWSWMEHGVLDEPVEYLCQIAHTEAVWLGLLREGEKAWEVGIRNEAKKPAVLSSCL